MILIVKLFEHAVKMKMDSVLDLLYLGGAIALVASPLSDHASEGQASAPKARARGLERRH